MASGRSLKSARHRVGRLEIALGVPAQTPPGVLERRLVTDAREHVVERPIGDIGKAHAVAGDDRQVKRRREIAQRVVVGFFVAQQMALQLDADVRRAERPDQAIDQPADAIARPVDDRAARRAPRARRPRRRDRRARARPRLWAPTASCASRAGTGSDSPRVTRRGRADGKAGARGSGLGTRSCSCSFRAIVSPEPRTPSPEPRAPSDTVSSAPTMAFSPARCRRLMKARDAVDAVAIEQRQRRIAERRGTLDEGFRQRRAVEKGKRGRRVQFDVHGVSASFTIASIATINRPINQ